MRSRRSLALLAVVLGLVLGLAGVLAGPVPSPALAAGNPSGPGGPEIIGGGPADPGQYPYHVAVVRTAIPGLPIRALRCGGVLISPDTVLTAGHCVFVDFPGRFRITQASDIDVIVGGTDLGLAVDGERVGVRRIIYDPRFDPATRAHNLAILQLASSVTATPAAVATPAQAALRAPGVPAVLAGFGLTAQNYNTPPSSVLNAATLPVIDPVECAASYGPAFDADQHLCAGDLEAGVPDACGGDGGGGLVADDAGTPTVIGVVSFNSGWCGQSTLPAVYARVDAEYDFIEPYLDPDTAPDAPRRVHLERGSGGPVLRWSPPYFDGGTVVTGYRVRVSPGGPVTDIAPGDRSLALPDLAPDRSYTVTVRARNAIGLGPPRTVTVHG